MKPPKMVPQHCVKNMTRGGILTAESVSGCTNNFFLFWLYLRYSPIFKSLDKLTVLLMTLCDQAAKYMFPTGRSGTNKPASILDKLFVAIPLPYLE